MRPTALLLLGVLTAAFAVPNVEGQLPRLPRRDLALNAREFPIPFAEYN